VADARKTCEELTNTKVSHYVLWKTSNQFKAATDLPVMGDYEKLQFWL
jgi:hypothetical protein